MPACLSRVAVSDLLCSLFFAQSVFKLFLWDIAFFVLAGKSFSHQAPVLKVASFLPALLLILGVTWLISSGDKNEDIYRWRLRTHLLASVSLQVPQL